MLTGIVKGTRLLSFVSLRQGRAHMGTQLTLARSSLRAGRYLQLRHKSIASSQKSTDAIAETSNTDTITRQPGAAFPGDIRSTSGLGLGDGIETHTGKWMTVRRSPAWGAVVKPRPPF